MYIMMFIDYAVLLTTLFATEQECEKKREVLLKLLMIIYACRFDMKVGKSLQSRGLE